MANYFYLKGRDGSFYEEQKQLLLKFLDERGYTNICFLHDTLDKMNERNYIGEALTKEWGSSIFKKFVKERSTEINGRSYSYGTVKTLGFDIDDFDVVVHIYAYSDSILKSLENATQPDHVFLYWVQDQPQLDEWVAVLNGQKIRPEENITPITWSHLNSDSINELDRIQEVNVGDGATHPSDLSLIKEVIKKINKKSKILDAPTFKAYLIREIGFSAIDANDIAIKCKNLL